jgi:hypothetical protein
MLRALMTCAVLLYAGSTFGQTWPCESLDGGYRECHIGTSGKIRLVLEMSSNNCFEGVSWGTRGEGLVWVDRGCRARFAIDMAPGGRIICESHRGSREVCPADTSKGIAVVRQLSKAPCIEGESWGQDDATSVIWVDHHCRAEFVVGPSGDVARVQPSLDVLVTCESDRRRRKTCAADTSAGVQFVRSLGDRACHFGRDWGYDTTGIWVDRGCRAEFAVRDKAKPLLPTVACASKSRTRTHCPADTRYGVALARFLGDEECTLDKTWGFDDDGVWVTNGCHALFALGGYRLPPEAVPATAMKVVCESLDGARKDCDIEIMRGVGLVRQLSERDCVLNRSWGYDRAGIWVTDGCRAEFAVAR